MAALYWFRSDEPASDGAELVDCDVILSAEPADLCREIARGDHDGSLAALWEFSTDPGVSEALRARMAHLGA
jgi:hypothetical protein